MWTVAIETAPTANRWRASLQPWPEAQTNLLVVESRDLQVRFADAAAWTMFDMHWRAREVGRHSGATGSVIQWREEPPHGSADDSPDGPRLTCDGGSVRQTIGTGHGGEVVRRVTLRVDDRESPVVAEGQLVGKPNRGMDGAHVRVHKESTIGPFDHDAIFEFSAVEPGFTVTHRYRANEGMARGRFAGYRYTFMFMLPETHDRYLVINGDGSSEQALIAPEPGMLLNRSFRALVCYSPADQTGMAYVYPEAYPGVNHINVRPGKDRKFRANLFQERYDVGDVAQFHVRIIPFGAQENQWAVTAANVIFRPSSPSQDP